MSPIDYKEQKLGINEARKQITKIINQNPENIRFSKHALKELKADGLTTVDALNILKSSNAKINQDGEFEKGSFRYRLETSNLMIVVGFWCDGTGINIITAWDKKKGK
jgi:hypothetical protein